LFNFLLSTSLNSCIRSSVLDLLWGKYWLNYFLWFWGQFRRVLFSDEIILIVFIFFNLLLFNLLFYILIILALRKFSIEKPHHIASRNFDCVEKVHGDLSSLFICEMFFNCWHMKNLFTAWAVFWRHL